MYLIKHLLRHLLSKDESFPQLANWCIFFPSLILMSCAVVFGTIFCPRKIRKMELEAALMDLNLEAIKSVNLKGISIDKVYPFSVSFCLFHHRIDIASYLIENGASWKTSFFEDDRSEELDEMETKEQALKYLTLLSM